MSQAVSAAAEDTDKQRRALDLLGTRALALSVQVIQEFYVQATRPSRPGPSRMRRPWASSNLFNVFPVQAIALDVMRAALTIRERFGLSWWDSAILAAARMCGCDAVYSEDPSDEQDYDGLRVVNPFTHSPDRM